MMPMESDTKAKSQSPEQQQNGRQPKPPGHPLGADAQHDDQCNIEQNGLGHGPGG
jgi:hypothetical protein